MNLSNLPPGVTQRMIDHAYAEDSPPLRCRHCRRYLRRSADRVRPWEDSTFCSGIVHIYDELYSADLIGNPSPVLLTGKLYSADCGADTAHGPHMAINWAGIYEGRKCRHCGRWSVECIT